jgi:hypothetical protein
MTMKNAITLSLFFLLYILCSQKLYAQNNRTHLTAGYGTYQLKSYKNFQDNLVKNGIPFSGVRAVDMFPNYVNWMISQERIFNPRHAAAVEFSYLYTGGRNSLVDYSGRYALDLLANSYRLGVSYTNYINDISQNGMVIGFLRFRAGWTRSHFNMKEEIEIINIHQQEMELSFFSDSFYLEFGPGLVYNINPYMSIHFSAGYEYELDATLKSSENKNVTLRSLDNKHVSTNWSGFRLRAGIGIDLVTFLGKKDQ